jgi:GNAT superfamily N-acetyltransferase
MPKTECAASDRSVVVATTLDIPKLHQLVNGAYRGDSSRQGWTTEADFLDGQRIDEQGLHELLTAPDSAILVLRSADALIGCCHVSRDARYKAYLGMVTVAPSLQGNGLGRLLLEAAEDYTRRQFGALYIRMTVISLRSELLQWYQRRGYQPTEERMRFPSDQPRFGIPKRSDLEFVVLEKTL